MLGLAYAPLKARDIPEYPPPRPLLVSQRGLSDCFRWGDLSIRSLRVSDIWRGFGLEICPPEGDLLRLTMDLI